MTLRPITQPGLLSVHKNYPLDKILQEIKMPTKIQEKLARGEVALGLGLCYPAPGIVERIGDHWGGRATTSRGRPAESQKLFDAGEAFPPNPSDRLGGHVMSPIIAILAPKHSATNHPESTCKPPVIFP